MYLIEFAKILSRYSLIVLLLFTYSLNLSPQKLFSGDTDSTEKTILVFSEADPDFSSDSETDIVDDTTVKLCCSDFFHGFLSELTHIGGSKVRRFFSIDLEIPIPPPRLVS